MTSSVFNKKISKVEKKIPDNVKYITTQEFKNLMAENFAARLKEVNLVNKADLD